MGRSTAQTMNHDKEEMMKKRERPGSKESSKLMNLMIPRLEKETMLAVSMAKKAASMARELKSMKSDMCFVQERCALLEEENSRLRDGFSSGIRPEEDDLGKPVPTPACRVPSTHLPRSISFLRTARPWYGPRFLFSRLLR
ncbi:hypothetical protein LINPERPRIM_LOCUS3844 [Linum perenne]